MHITILIIGNPEKQNNSLSVGVVSGLNRKLKALPSIVLIQIDASVDYGSSGSPVIDNNGKVIGVISYGFRNSGFGFAIPVNLVEYLIEE